MGLLWSATLTSREAVSVMVHEVELEALVVSAAAGDGAAYEADAATVAAYSIDETNGTQANAEVERGRYLVTGFGCTDCHTPWIMGPNGPMPDETRFLAGHPADLVMPPAPKLEPGPWLISVAGTNTAWAGPWGVSFTANLTPDDETGLGRWTSTMG